MANKKIAILFGMENTFPPALVDKINGMKTAGVTAEFVKIGGIRMDEPKKYDVIIDRISQDIPFYRAYLKERDAAGHASSSTIHSGGPRTTNFSTTRWPTKWAWRFRQR